MAVVSSDVLAAIFTEYRIIFNDAFLAARNVNSIDRIAMQVQSSTLQEVYTWFGTVPKMREWTDQRAYDSLVGESYTLVNKHYEASMELDRDTIADDRYNLLLPKVRQLATEAQRYPTELAMTTLATGETALGYDNTPFFGSTHVDFAGQATQNNLITGTGVTLAAVRADLISARNAGRRFADQQGRPMNINFDLVVAPPEMEDVFRQILQTTIIALASGSQQTNVLQGTFDLLIDPYLTNVNNWYLLDTKEELKPLIYQMRQAPDFQAQDNPAGDVAFNQRKFRYGVDFRAAVGFGLWQTAAKVKNS